MTPQQVKVPDTWQGGEAAYIAFEALVRAGKRPGADFSYHPPARGRRMGADMEADFSFVNPPDLAMRVQDSFYSPHEGADTEGTDIMTKAQFAGQGVTLIMLKYDKLLQDSDWIIGEALRYRDHS